MNLPAVDRLAFFTELEIAVARLRTIRLNSEGQQSAVAFDMIRPGGHRRAELRLVTDEVVGGQHHADAVRVGREDRVGGEADAGRRVAPDGLDEDVGGRNLGKKSSAGVRRGRRRHEPDPLRGHETFEPLECQAQQRRVAHQLEQLLGSIRARRGPETGA